MSPKRSKNALRKYLPRHFRLGVCCSVPDLRNFQEIREEIPVVNDNGDTVYSKSVLKCVDADENMSKYKASAFRLSAMVENGVPLRVVNVNSSNSVTIDKLLHVCENIDSADQFIKRVLDQQKERESWLQPVSDDLVSGDGIIES